MASNCFDFVPSWLWSKYLVARVGNTNAQTQWSSVMFGGCDSLVNDHLILGSRNFNGKRTTVITNADKQCSRLLLLLLLRLLLLLLLSTAVHRRTFQIHHRLHRPTDSIQPKTYEKQNFTKIYSSER